MAHEASVNCGRIRTIGMYMIGHENDTADVSSNQLLCDQHDAIGKITFVSGSARTASAARGARGTERLVATGVDDNAPTRQ